MGQWLLKLARSSLASIFLHTLFAYFSFMLPVQRLYDTPTLMAFHHPQPSYPFHVLLVPKRALASLADLTVADQPLLGEIMQTVNQLVKAFELETVGYRLIVNGGAYQDVPHLHFHLVSDKSLPTSPQKS